MLTTSKKQKNKAEHLQKGEHWEHEALTFLKKNGLTPLQKNYHCNYGEIDLIMLDTSHIIFVEVRYRKNDNFGDALQSVNSKKQIKIANSAQNFLIKNNRIGINKTQIPQLRRLKSMYVSIVRFKGMSGSSDVFIEYHQYPLTYRLFINHYSNCI